MRTFQYRTVRFCRAASALLALAACSLLPTVTHSAKVSILNTGDQPGHYLVWNDKPIIAFGDSVTQGWMESGTNFNQTGYLDALASRGVNVAMLWSYIGTDSATQIADDRIGYNAPEIWPWQGSTDGNTIDLGTFNEAYFDRLANFVSYAESKGILVLICVQDGWTKTRFPQHPFRETEGNGPLSANTQFVALANYGTEMPTTFNPAWTRQQKNQYYQERFADKLISTLEPYSNVMYEMFNEGEWYNQTQRRQHEEHFLKFFRARTDALLMTNSDHISGFNPHQNPHADMISLHPNPWTGNFGKYATAFNATPAKPAFVSEPVPEFRGTNLTIADIRRSAWEAAVAGAGWVAQNDTSFGWDPNTAMASHAAVRDEVYTLTGRVARFMNNSGVPFWNMAPNGGLTSTGMALVKPGAEYLVYAPTGGSFTVNLSATGGQTRNVHWYDPRTGVTTSSDTVAATGNRTFVAPDGNDWVLRVGASPYLDTTKIAGWEFNANGNREGWTANSTAGDLGVSSGRWNLIPSGSDPILTGPEIDIPANLATMVAIGIRSFSSTATGQLFWKVEGDAGFSEARSQTFSLIGGGTMRTYYFDLGADPDWTGRITQLRLDPIATGNGSSIAIDFVRLLTTSQPGDYNSDGIVDAADYIVWKKTNIYGELGYELWRNHFGLSGSGSGGSVVNGVPEPSAAVVWLIAAAVLGAVCRRRETAFGHGYPARDGAPIRI